MKHIRISEGGRPVGVEGASLEEVAAALRDKGGHQRVLIHAHGGLVGRDEGLAIAGRLAAGPYRDLDCPMVFPVWQSDVLTTVKTNLGALAKRPALLDVLGALLDWALGKVGGQNARSSDEQGISEDELKDLLADFECAVEEPGEAKGVADWLRDAELDLSRDDPAKDAADEKALTEAIERSPAVHAVAEAIESRFGPSADSGRGDGATADEVDALLASLHPELAAELIAGARTGELESDRSFAGSALALYFGRKAVTAARATLKRYRRGRDHGLWPTLVEEAVRVLLAGDLATGVWEEMKGNARKCFSKGGDLVPVLKALDKVHTDLKSQGGSLTLMLCGHSAGAIWHCQMLLALARAKQLTDAAIDLVFLAPAVDYELFTLALGASAPKIRRFRTFAMTDEAERADRMLGRFYPRSLLYLVSGLLEAGEADDLLVGLERSWRLDADALSEVEVNRHTVASLLLGRDGAFLFGPTGPESQPPDSSHADAHGEFDRDEATLASVAAFLDAAPVG